MKEMNAVVDALKGVTVRELANIPVVAMRDYSADVRVETATGKKEALGIPKCNCIYYELQGGSFVCVRPSGTEPKLKVYYSVRAGDECEAEGKLIELKAAVANLLASVR